MSTTPKTSEKDPRNPLPDSQPVGHAQDYDQPRDGDAATQTAREARRDEKHNAARENHQSRDAQAPQDPVEMDRKLNKPVPIDSETPAAHETPAKK